MHELLREPGYSASCGLVWNMHSQLLSAANGLFLGYELSRLRSVPGQLPLMISDEAMMKHSGAKQEGESASQLISKRIAELGDWRGETLRRIRPLIKEADPDILEEWKWMGTPVWSHNGIVCTGETYKKVVKMTFAKGASLKDPSRLFNSSLDGNARRAIDIHEGEEIDAPALKALIRAAVALNVSGRKAAPPQARRTLIS